MRAQQGLHQEHSPSDVSAVVQLALFTKELDLLKSEREKTNPAVVQLARCAWGFPNSASPMACMFASSEPGP